VHDVTVSYGGGGYAPLLYQPLNGATVASTLDQESWIEYWSEEIGVDDPEFGWFALELQIFSDNCRLVRFEDVGVMQQATGVLPYCFHILYRDVEGQVRCYPIVENGFVPAEPSMEHFYRFFGSMTTGRGKKG